MPFDRYNARRGGIVRLESQFKKNGVLTDPYALGLLDILDASDNIVTGEFFGVPGTGLSGLSPISSSTGIYIYDFQTISGMTPGIYQDRWNDIQFNASSTITSGLFAFTVLFNEDDLSNWDILPG